MGMHSSSADFVECDHVLARAPGDNAETLSKEKCWVSEEICVHAEQHAGTIVQAQLLASPLRCNAERHRRRCIWGFPLSCGHIPARHRRCQEGAHEQTQTSVLAYVRGWVGTVACLHDRPKSPGSGVGLPPQEALVTVPATGVPVRSRNVVAAVQASLAATGNGSCRWKSAMGHGC